MRSIATGLSLLVLCAAGGACAGERAAPPMLAQLADLTAADLRATLPPAASTVLLVPAARRGDDEFSPALDAALRRRGYAVVSSRAAAPSAAPVRYAVLQAWDGYVLQLEVGGQASTQFFRPDAGGRLTPAGPRTIKEPN